MRGVRIGERGFSIYECHSSLCVHINGIYYIFGFK